jgi:drug/metabolite transporter, DME family
MTYRLGVALVVAAGFIWSLNVLLTKSLAAENTWAVLAWRSVGMVPVLAGFIWWRSGSLWAAFRGFGPVAVLGSAALTACFAAAIYALQNTTAANAVFPLAVTPFISAVLARVWLGEPVRTATWAAIALAIVGVFVMVGEGLSAGQTAGTLMALANAACFAIFTVALRAGGATDTLPGVLLGAVFSIIAGTMGATMTGGTLAFSPGLLAIALTIGIVILGLGLTLFTLGARAVPAAELSLLSMLEVILSPVWVWLFLGQTSSPMTFVGGGIVIAAIGFNAISGLARGARTA